MSVPRSLVSALIFLGEFQQSKALRDVEDIGHWSLPCYLVTAGFLAAK
jgi:hypothetical protein